MYLQHDKTILSEKQWQVLDKVATSELTQYFYLSGGTALAEFHIPYRLSEDLDFFSEQEVDITAVLATFKKWQIELGIEKFDINSSLNRNLLYFHFPDNYVLKTEFTYYPFIRLENSQQYKDLGIDSLLDIAVNKLFTIYQNPRSRDFMDLYMIVHQENWTLDELRMKAKLKFDWHVDPLKLGSQFLKATKLKDYPHLITDLQPDLWIAFFTEEATRLGTREIVE